MHFRLSLTISLIALSLFAPAVSEAKPAIGLADNTIGALQDSRFQESGLKRVRILVPYDVVARGGSKLAELDQYMNLAQAQGLEVMVSWYRTYACAEKCAEEAAALGFGISPLRLAVHEPLSVRAHVLDLERDQLPGGPADGQQPQARRPVLRRASQAVPRRALHRADRRLPRERQQVLREVAEDVQGADRQGPSHLGHRSAPRDQRLPHALHQAVPEGRRRATSGRSRRVR